MESERRKARCMLGSSFDDQYRFALCLHRFDRPRRYLWILYLRDGSWQDNGNGGAVSGLAGQMHRAAMALDNAAAQWQPQAAALSLRFGGKEGLEDPTL
jgi:hypothetical protein